MSFSMFKQCFFENSLPFNFGIGEDIYPTTIIKIDANNKSLNSVQEELCNFLDSMIDILSDLKQSGDYFDSDDLAGLMLKKGCAKKKYVAEIVASSFIPMIEKIDPYKNTIVKRPFSRYNSQTDKFMINTSSYEDRIQRLKHCIKKFIFGDRRSMSKCVSPSDKMTIITTQLIELLELAFCSITAGDKPEFFIRVNNAYTIEKIVNNPNYMSRSVANVRKKHNDSCVLMKYFFTGLNSDADRWNFIERYFLGHIDEDEMTSIKDQLHITNKTTV